MVKIKICGLMTKEDCVIMNGFKPDYCGLVFAKTRHYLTDQMAGELRNTLDISIPTVGVFVDDDMDHIVELYNSAIIQIIQLHGHEDAEYIRQLRDKIAASRPDKKRHYDEFGQGAPIMKAIRVKDGSEFEDAENLPVDMLLLDNYKENLPGGTGTRFDLSMIPKLNKPYFLAGGLSADNITQALAQSRPYAVDVSTSVETDGHKDWKKVEKLMRVMEAYRPQSQFV
ncbi:MAG: phosphoribosylanthranilate isomerase [Butyrivibrio sp.]|uniref:phosphoribosylanthranilate isomerase n=1 Tax=Butyrivibrio sp. TaxID=28121 RepID=UPI00260060EA|nr:phosphoribosylanthranilate isomerase [Butyrivibrio sp.]MCR5772059.1 phosphoribosylanthranilate isomerase [Butyrivibrio sp.]